MDGVPEAPGSVFRKSVGPAALYQVSAANRRDIHTNCGGHMSTLCERPRYAVFRSLMPETAALLLEWVKDKQPEDYLFPAGRLSAVPHVGRIRFYQVSVPIADRLVSPRIFSHPHCLKHALATHVIHTIGIQHTRQ